MGRQPKQTKKMQRSNKGPQTERVANGLVISRGVGMPRQFRTKLRFAISQAIAHAGTVGVYGFGCNTPNQPSRSLSTTEVPAYYTQLASLYDRCYTNSSCIRLEVVNVTVSDGVQVVLSSDTDTTTTTSINTLMERTGAQSHMLGYYSGGDAKASFQSHWQPKPFIGVSPDSPDNTVVGAIDPPNPYYWMVAIKSTGGGTGNVVMQVVIEYDVTFHELTLPY